MIEEARGPALLVNGTVVWLKIARIFGGLAGVWGVAITLALLFLPLLQVCERIYTTGGQEYSGCLGKTLIDWQGGSLQPMTSTFLGGMASLAVIICILSWKPEKHARARGFIVLICGLLLIFGVFISGFSIGFYYAPGTLLALMCATILLGGQPG